MLIKVFSGRFDAERGDLEPASGEVWLGEEQDLSGAALTVLNNSIELGTWYKFDEFSALIDGIPEDVKNLTVSAITVGQPGVADDWSSTIEVSEPKAVLMMVEAAIEHAQRLHETGDLWVRVE